MGFKKHVSPTEAPDSGLDRQQAATEIARRPFGISLGVCESDQVGNLVVAEEGAQLPVLTGVAPGTVEPFLVISQAAVHAFSQNFLVRGNQADAALGDDTERFVADRTIGWAHHPWE